MVLRSRLRRYFELYFTLPTSCFLLRILSFHDGYSCRPAHQAHPQKRLFWRWVRIGIGFIYFYGYCRLYRILNCMFTRDFDQANYGIYHNLFLSLNPNGMDVKFTESPTLKIFILVFKCGIFSINKIDVLCFTITMDDYVCL